MKREPQTANLTASARTRDILTFAVAAVNSMLITGTITAKQKVRQKVPGLYAVCR